MSSSQPALNGRLSQLMPLHFAGGFTLEQFSEECPQCRMDIPETAWEADGGWLNASACSMKLTANCPRCGTASTLNLRIRSHAGGSATIDQQVNGQWVHATVGNVPPLVRAKLLARRMLGLDDGNQ